ncbi:sulfite exporter TauE/SafE family protein [Desulfosarcina cetonica]|nr:sulfite exporter TauE/SafE family protein [Desulfosarcina cetonica]
MTTSMDFAALFMLGLLGTGHCIGMCGPLVVALPGQTGRLSAHLPTTPVG